MFELIPFGRPMNRAMTYDPFREMDEFLFSAPARQMNVNPFKTDVIDKGDAYELVAELPGFSKEDIKLDIENNCLTISAERKLEEKEDKPNFVKRERFYGSYSRSFDLEGINVDGIEASYDNGVLVMKLPKVPEDVPVSRSIEIK